VVAVRSPLQSPADGNSLTAPSTGAEVTVTEATVAAATVAAATGAAATGAEAIVAYRFRQPELLREALTHRSAAAERGPRGKGRRHGIGSNERLEFLGDRVLGLLVAEWLIERFPAEPEGKLGPRLAQLVSGPVLASIAEAIGLPAALDIAPGEVRTGVGERETVRADATEAVIGALYLDGGLDAARQFVRRAFAGAIEGQALPPKDPKTALQEWALSRALPLPTYLVTARSGPPHDPSFVIEVTVAGRTGRGVARSKRLAEREAARALLEQLS